MSVVNTSALNMLDAKREAWHFSRSMYNTPNPNTYSGWDERFRKFLKHRPELVPGAIISGPDLDAFAIQYDAGHTVTIIGIRQPKVNRVHLRAHEKYFHLAPENFNNIFDWLTFKRSFDIHWITNEEMLQITMTQKHLSSEMLENQLDALVKRMLVEVEYQMVTHSNEDILVVGSTGIVGSISSTVLFRWM